MAASGTSLRRRDRIARRGEVRSDHARELLRADQQPHAGLFALRRSSGSFVEYVKNFKSLSYELTNVVGTDRYSAAEALFTYVCNDGSVEVVAHAYLCERDEAGLLTPVRVYGDTTRILKPFMVAND